jgi:hypothetical protein
MLCAGLHCLIRRTLSMKDRGFLFSWSRALCWYPMARAAVNVRGLYKFTLTYWHVSTPLWFRDWRTCLVWLPPSISIFVEPSICKFSVRMSNHYNKLSIIIFFKRISQATHMFVINCSCSPWRVWRNKIVYMYIKCTCKKKILSINWISSYN